MCLFVRPMLLFALCMYKRKMPRAFACCCGHVCVGVDDTNIVRTALCSFLLNTRTMPAEHDSNGCLGTSSPPPTQNQRHTWDWVWTHLRPHSQAHRQNRSRTPRSPLWDIEVCTPVQLTKRHRVTSPAVTPQWLAVAPKMLGSTHRTPATGGALTTPFRIGLERNTFRTPQPLSPLTPQASLRLPASLELVAMEGDAPPTPHQALDFEASSYPPPPCRSPPLVVPQGGVGDRHLANPKIFVAAHCVVVWVTVLWGTATCIPCTHDGTFCLLSLKWNLKAQPCFPL